MGSITAAVAELGSLAARYGARPLAQRKVATIKSIASLPGRWSRGSLLALHDSLLFLTAWPDSMEVYREACRALDGLPQQIARCGSSLGGEGLVGTEIRSCYDHALLDWLQSRYPNTLSIDWDQFEDPNLLLPLLELLTGAAEEPGIEDSDWAIQDWLQSAAGADTDLDWLLSKLRALDIPARARSHLFDSLSLPFVWTVPKRASRSDARLPLKEFRRQSSAINRAAPRVLQRIRKPLRGHLQGNRSSRTWIELARTCLSSRVREMYPITHASPLDVVRYRSEEGVDIVCMGVVPERRFLLEAQWGFLLARNGVPLGYGCFDVALGAAEIAANIFPPFRRGPSARIYTDLLRVIHHHTGASTFWIEPYQFGADNEEAIAAGAYWFYDKLGFRSVEPHLQALAQKEREQIARRSGYRSRPALLRRLAQASLVLRLPKSDAPVGLSLAHLGQAITKHIATEHGGHRSDAIAASRRKLTRHLGRLPKGSSVDEFALLLQQLDWEAWSPLDLAALRATLVARSLTHERDFARRCGRLNALRSSVIQRCCPGDGQ